METLFNLYLVFLSLYAALTVAAAAAFCWARWPQIRQAIRDSMKRHRSWGKS